MFRLKKPGYKVYSASDLTTKGYPGAAGGEIYAVFEVEPDAAYAGRKWDEPEVTKQTKAFDSRRCYRQVNTLHRRSPDPRVLRLQDLLRAMRRMALPARIPVRQEGVGSASVGRTGAGVKKAPDNSMQRTALRAAADAER